MTSINSREALIQAIAQAFLKKDASLGQLLKKGQTLLADNPFLLGWLIALEKLTNIPISNEVPVTSTTSSLQKKAQNEKRSKRLFEPIKFPFYPHQSHAFKIFLEMRKEVYSQNKTEGIEKGLLEERFKLEFESYLKNPLKILENLIETKFLIEKEGIIFLNPDLV